MTANAEFNFVGLKDDLRVLQDLDKSLRRQITKDFAQIVEAPVRDAQAHVPNSAPLSGMARRWKTKSGYEMFPWQGAAAAKSIKAFTSGKKPKEFNGITRNLAVFGIRWKNARAALIDMSRDDKTPQGAIMVRALNNRYGRASRIMWPAYERHRTEVLREVEVLVDGVMKSADKLTRGK